VQDLNFLDETISVSDAINFADSLLKEIVFVVQGEVTDIKDRSSYKAIYFSIKDEKSILKCHIWKNRISEDDFSLEEGSLVNLTGRFSIYAKRGDLSFDVLDVKLAGEGDLRAKVNKIIEKFRDQGYFDPENKKELIDFPERIGLITSGAGAAIHDVIRTIKRRAKSIEINFYGVGVEGKNASHDILSALKTLDDESLDCILIVRGGGSFEDLMPFNDEDLCRGIFNAKTPIVTGIGHEPDTTIADLVADVRASTPTAAAETITANLVDLDEMVKGGLTSLNNLISFNLFSTKQKIEQCKTHLDHLSPKNVLREQKMNYDYAYMRLRQVGLDMFSKSKSELSNYAKRLEDLSPLSVLSRGYAYVSREEGNVIKAARECNVDDNIIVRFSDGKVKCEVKEKL
jgi:exodeoxyribonuclease VII large subunit